MKNNKQNYCLAMVCIYVLKLKNNKYYVGKTKNPNARIDEHFLSNGSEWTSIHELVCIVEIIPNCDDFDEDKYVVKYMNKFGIENVRGGSFVQCELSDENKKTLNQMIKGASNKCFKCGKSDHFVVDCALQHDTIKEQTSTNIYSHQHNEYNACYRCGRTTHYANKCYAKTNVNGNYIDDDN